MNDGMKLFAAYDDFLLKRRMEFVCPGSTPAGTTWINDHRLVFQGLPNEATVNLVPEKGLSVPAGVYEITEAHELLLDDWLGVSVGNRIKTTVNVVLDGETVPAVIYYNPNPVPLNAPSTQYWKIIEGGYADFNLPDEVLFKYLEHSVHNRAAS